MDKGRYKNSRTSEYIHTSKIRPPFRIIDGEIVRAKRNEQGTGWIWE
jgi:hypothetical protein